MPRRKRLIGVCYVQSRACQVSGLQCRDHCPLIDKLCTRNIDQIASRRHRSNFTRPQHSITVVIERRTHHHEIRIPHSIQQAIPARSAIHLHTGDFGRNIFPPICPDIHFKALALTGKALSCRPIAYDGYVPAI